MERIDIITFLNTKQIDSSKAVELVLEYAEDTKHDHLDKLAAILNQNPQLMSIALQNVTPHLLRKYNICSVSKIDPNLPFEARVPVYYF